MDLDSYVREDGSVNLEALGVGRMPDLKDGASIYGYARVSSRDQKLDRQIDALEKFGVPRTNIFTDKQTGANFNREGYQALLDILQPGDYVVITSLDRLGREYHEIQKQWHELIDDREVYMKVLNMPLLDTANRKDILGTFIADIAFQIFSFQAEQERQAIKQRQAEGIALAKARGVYNGRPRKEIPPELDIIYVRFKNGVSINHLYNTYKDQLNMSQSTFRERLYEKMYGKDYKNNK